MYYSHLNLECAQFEYSSLKLICGWGSEGVTHRKQRGFPFGKLAVLSPLSCHYGGYLQNIILFFQMPSLRMS